MKFTHAGAFALAGAITTGALLALIVNTSYPLPVLSEVGLMILTGAVCAPLGWSFADRTVVDRWRALPSAWKLDPILIDERGVTGAFEDSLNPEAPRATLTIPYSRIGSVARSPEGWWVSGWDHAEWITEAWKACLSNHPEAARKHPMTHGLVVKQHVEEILGRKPSEVPLFDRGGIFVLTPSNGELLKIEWERRRSPLPSPRGA